MNENRMKYASTPTYGMQKRGFFKKAPIRQAPEAPDFSKAPAPMPVLQQQGAMSAQPMPFSQPATPAGAAVPTPSYFSAVVQPPQQSPYASYASPMGGLQPPFYSGASFVQPQVSQSPPLGNSAPPLSSSTSGFSPRAQGYVPPVNQPQPAVPSIQPAPFGGQSPAPFQSVPFQPQGVPFSQTPPAAPQQMGFVPTPPMQQGNAPFTLRTSPKPPKERTPLNADKLWAGFLFGFLPIAFIACLFVPQSLFFLRYIFLGLCVVGLGGMWYRQMYGSTTRLIVSMAYVALCIVLLAMTMQGGRDARQQASPVSAGSTVQETLLPDDSLGEANPQQPLEAEPTPSLADSGPSQAQLRLESFMTLWQVNNTQEMVSFVQPSWASEQENPSTSLFMVLSNRTPEEFTIEEVSGSDQDSSRTVTMTALINKNDGKDPVLYRFMVLMVQEGNEWYVDPNSLATNDKITESDENVVNDLSVAAATATPRTTVTPAPPADTTLYYNVNGGSLYHLDPYCSSVDDAYLPLTGTFSYAELSSYMNGTIKTLSPCLKCGAPTSTLSDSE